MSKLLIFVLAAGLVALVAAIWVRVAPSDPAKWHVVPQSTSDQTLRNSAVRVIDGDANALAALDKIIMDTPRTTRLAGSVKAGMITYVTRSALFRFPDYTTIRLTNEGRIVVHGRARFGLSDAGVNGRRINTWLQGLVQ